MSGIRIYSRAEHKQAAMRDPECGKEVVTFSDYVPSMTELEEAAA